MQIYDCVMLLCPFIVFMFSVGQKVVIRLTFKCLNVQENSKSTFKCPLNPHLNVLLDI